MELNSNMLQLEDEICEMLDTYMGYVQDVLLDTELSELNLINS